MGIVRHDAQESRARAEALRGAGLVYSDFLSECQTAKIEEFTDVRDHLFEVASRCNCRSLEYAAHRLSYIREYGITAFNVGGTMGSGKSSFGRMLASRFSFDFQDADIFHTESNRKKMSEGTPLTDYERVPFLRGVSEYLRQNGKVSSCSSLTDLHRSILAGKKPQSLLDSGLVNNWAINSPNYGLQNIILTKPYEVALAELDESANDPAKERKLAEGKHFISVSIQSEYEARLQGEPPLLLSQYQLFRKDLIYPWEAIIIDTTTFRSEMGYNCQAALERIARLPVAIPSLRNESFSGDTHRRAYG